MELNPFDICPCGSGKIYKECHGKKDMVKKAVIMSEHASPVREAGGGSQTVSPKVYRQPEVGNDTQDEPVMIQQPDIAEPVMIPQPDIPEPVMIPQPDISEPVMIPDPGIQEPTRIPQPFKRDYPAAECVTLRKGQRVSLGMSGSLGKIRCEMGWQPQHPQCCIDVSAFLLGESGKVPSEDWFVFYQQTISPDGAVEFQETNQGDIKETIGLDFSRISSEVHKIVFVLTIDEAFDKGLNFSMVNNVFLRVKDANNPSQDLFSYNMEEYYASITSVMICEIYRRNNEWKLHIIGNGVNKDLAGLCELYGVETE